MQIDPRRQQAAVSSQEAERAAARGGGRLRAAAGSSAPASCSTAGAISKQEQEQARDGAAHRGSEPQGAAGAGAAAGGAAALLHASPRRPPASSATCRCASAMQVTPQTLLTTIDQNETLEVERRRCRSSARRELKIGLPMQCSSSDGSRRSRRPRSASSRRASTIRRSRCSSRAIVQEPGRRAARVAVRPRADRLEDGATAWSCRSPPCCASTASSSRSSPSTAPTASSVAQAARDQGRPDRRRRLRGARRPQAGRAHRRLGHAEAGGRRADQRAAAARPQRQSRAKP